MNSKKANCPEYFKYEGKVYQCVGNDDNQFWAIIDGESKGFEQSNCIKLYPKTAYVASDFVTDISILVNGEICMVDHIKPYDFSTSVKDGYCVVFENEERCILETEESDIIKIFEPTYEAPPTPSKELKSAEEVLKWYGVPIPEYPDGRKSLFAAMEAYASQLHPSPTPDTVEFAEWVRDNMYVKYWGSDEPNNNKWYKQYSSPHLRTFYTTQELYSLFKNQKQ